MSTELFLNFVGIRIDSRRVEGMPATMNLIATVNGEKRLVELENVTQTNIQDFQADKPGPTLTVNRSDPEQTMMGPKTLEAQIKDGTAKGLMANMPKIDALNVKVGGSSPSSRSFLLLRPTMQKLRPTMQNPWLPRCIAVIALSAASFVHAGESPTPPSAGGKSDESATLFPIPKLTGSIWERERLLGDLGGPRQTLAEHGVQLDFTLTQIYQGVMSGGDTNEWARSVGVNAARTLLGEVLDLTAERRAAARTRIVGIARERLQEVGARARGRFAALPPETQQALLEKIGAVPPQQWAELRGLVRGALESKVAAARGTLETFIQDRIAKLNLGNFGNTGLEAWDYFGTWSGEVKLDTQKMGLWPGGFVFMRVQADYGDAVNQRAGSLMPVNADAIFPEPGLDEVTIPHLYFVQFLSEQVGVVVGKLDTLTGDQNEFAQYAGGERFLNLAFGLNPVTAANIPYSALGASLIVLPTKDLTITATVLDGDGTAAVSGFDTVFSGKTTYAAEARLTTHFFGRTGHQLVGGIYAAGGGYNELNQDLLAFVPRAGVAFKDTSDTWAFYYNFDQYLWTRPEDPTRGWGVFGRFGVADDTTNPIAQFYSIGLGGKGAFASRPHDRWGVGYYYTKVSDQLPSFLELSDEQGGEAFYNFAVTPAFMITADLQVVKSARQNVDTAVVGGIRAVLRF